MQLQLLYELKERLEVAAIAGVGLLDDDFRLKRAWEALAPLATASPVVTKVHAAVGRLLTAPVDGHGDDGGYGDQADTRSGLLLDALALVDAICYTQGVTDLPGDWEPLPRTGAGTYCAVAYSQLQPLLDALTSSAIGRLQVLTRNWENHPEFFSDFRVLPWVVRALGDDYTELARKVEEILPAIGEMAFPLLVEGFDLAGGSEMVRRVRVMEQIARQAAAEQSDIARQAAAGQSNIARQANAFYCAKLEDAACAAYNVNDHVRQALIYALRHDDSNVDRLLTLCQTERSAAQKMAHHALAQLDTPATWVYWDTRIAKITQNAGKSKRLATAVVWYLTDADSRAAGERINRLLLEQLAPLVADPGVPVGDERRETITLLLYALAHKPGETVADSVRQAALAASRDGADWVVPTDKVITYGYWGIYDNIPFPQALPLFLERALLIRPDTVWLQLAMELYETYGGAYLSLALMAQLLTQSGKACYDWARAQLPPDEDWDKPEVQETLAVFRETCRCTLGTFKKFQWNPASCNYEFSFHYACAATGKPQTVTQPLAGRFDLRWYALLIQLQDDKHSLDSLLYRLADSRLKGTRHDTALWKAIGSYLCRRILTATADSRFDNIEFIYLLQAFHWPHWKGVLRQEVEQTGILDLRRVRHLLRAMPLHDYEQAAELRELDQWAERARGTRLKYCHWDKREVQALIRDLERSANKEDGTS